MEGNGLDVNLLSSGTGFGVADRLLSCWNQEDIAFYAAFA